MAFKMKGHTLPGIKQRMDKSSTADGRAKSSAFQDDKKGRPSYDPYTAEGQRNIKKARQKKKQRDLERGYTDKAAYERRKELRSILDNENEVKQEMAKWKARRKANTTYVKISKEDLLKSGGLSLEQSENLSE